MCASDAPDAPEIKKTPKKFSLANSMIPSCIPHELQGLTQVEEMLIACALPIMRVYIKPGLSTCSKMSQNLPYLCQDAPKTWLLLL